MVGPTMNLISGVHHSCEMREHAFMVLREYTIISQEKKYKEKAIIIIIIIVVVVVTANNKDCGEVLLNK